MLPSSASLRVLFGEINWAGESLCLCDFPLISAARCGSHSWWGNACQGRQTMSAGPAIRHDAFTPFEQLRLAREVLRTEGSVLLDLANRLGDEFCRAVTLVHSTRGSVIVTGMGKAGLVGQKVAATLASTGTRSHFLHPAEAIHGDLGRIHKDDA